MEAVLVETLFDPLVLSNTSDMHVREAFNFVFKGYSIWLGVGQTDKDLEKAIAAVSMEHSLYPVPEPHCTVAYGIDHLTEKEMRCIFREKIAPVAKNWPALETEGSHVGISYDGVDGEEMDMAWMEVTLKSSPEHEKLVDKIYACLYPADDNEDNSVDGDDVHRKTRPGPWKPHLSLAYDNPQGSAVDAILADKIFARFPSLLGRKERRVKNISLWRTEGRIWEWECLERVELCQKNEETHS